MCVDGKIEKQEENRGGTERKRTVSISENILAAETRAREAHANANEYKTKETTRQKRPTSVAEDRVGALSATTAAVWVSDSSVARKNDAFRAAAPRKKDAAEASVESALGRAVVGLHPTKQEAVDGKMFALGGTPN